jgi:hypothetical protein
MAGSLRSTQTAALTKRTSSERHNEQVPIRGVNAKTQPRTTADANAHSSEACSSLWTAPESSLCGHNPGIGAARFEPVAEGTTIDAAWPSGLSLAEPLHPATDKRIWTRRDTKTLPAVRLSLRSPACTSRRLWPADFDWFEYSGRQAVTPAELPLIEAPGCGGEKRVAPAHAVLECR